MDYKEKYQMALERAKIELNADTTQGTKNILMTVFPELKESEDEKIKKDVKRAISVALDYSYFDKETANNCLAWLEKQGEQKPVVDFKAKDWYVSKVDGQIHDMTYNPANKIKSKFKVGDWIIFNGFILHIDEVVDGYYKTTTFDGIPNSYDWDIDNVARLWVIQDAKEGDVLAEDTCIFIIQKLGDNSTAAKTYCTLYNDGDFDDGTILYFDIDSTKPATKEQRDLLFSKMKDAGYEWDAEKKELKKIEDEIEIPFGAKDSELQEETYYIPKGFHAIIDDDKVVIKKGEKPATWGDEDESCINNAIAACRSLYGEYSETAHWLKSLKDRVQGKEK